MYPRPTFSQIVASWTPEKRASDGIWTRFVLRPLSFPTAYVFLRLGWSANAVTYAGALLCVGGFFPLAFGSGAAVYVGFLCFFLFGILDCADGNMARTLGGGSPGGAWADAVGGYVAYSTVLLGMGAAEGSQFWTLVAGVAAASNLLMRLAVQSYRAKAEKKPDGKEVGGEKMLSETIGITGFLVPAATVAYALGRLDVVIAAYAVVYGGGCLVVLIKLIKRVESEGKERAVKPGDDSEKKGR